MFYCEYDMAVHQDYQSFVELAGVGLNDGQKYISSAYDY
jgi:hypothetical protein